MRVISKLAQIDFVFGKVTKEGSLLVIDSDPDSAMPSRVYISPQDVIEFLKRFLISPTAILFVLGFPYFLYRWKTSGGAVSQKQHRKKDWPTV